MADYKIISIIGIHAKEELFNGDPDAKWNAIKQNPDFVAGALFKGGQVAPLSGQSFRLVEAKAKGNA